jgi:hypothetical protein
MTFLESLKASDLAADTTGMVWPAAQIALRDARLRQIPDAGLQVRFLEDSLTGMRDGRGPLADWAVNELCDRGSVGSTPVVIQSIRSRGNGLRDEEELEFCVARIRVVAGNPDPVKALAPILDVQSDSGDAQRGLSDPRRRLAGWAIDKLNSMQSASADAELDRFARQIEALPEGPRKAGLAGYHRSILELQAQRAVR